MEVGECLKLVPIHPHLFLEDSQLRDTVSAVSQSIRSAGAVLLFLNMKGRGLLPKDVEFVSDEKKSEVREPGIMILEEKLADIGSLLQLLGIKGFVAASFTAIDRKEGRVRVSAPLLKVELLTEKTISAERERELGCLLRNFVWDVRIYRNPGEDGGNFAIEAGNPKLAKRHKSLGKLTLYGDEFDFRPAEVLDPTEQRKLLRSALRELSR